MKIWIFLGVTILFVVVLNGVRKKSIVTTITPENVLSFSPAPTITPPPLAPVAGRPVRREPPEIQRAVAPENDNAGQAQNLSANIEGKVYSIDEFKKHHPEMDLSAVPAGATITEAASKYSNEKTIGYTKLKTECPSLSRLKFPVSLRISGNGDITEATPILAGFSPAEIPPEIYRCKFEGGGNEPYVTNVSPGMLSRKSKSGFDTQSN